MTDDPKITVRRGLPKPLPEIQKLLVDQYNFEKSICRKIEALDRQDPARVKLFAEVYEFAHIASEKYKNAGFLQQDPCYKTSFGKIIDKLFLNKGRLLELGCGQGTLLSYMKTLGWECKGVDIDTKQVLADIKDDVQSADILFFNDGMLYDLIIIDQVLEHIPKRDALFFITNARSMLRQGGFIISRTPNRLNGPHDISRWFLPLGAKAQGTHFNELTLAETLQLFKKAGFKDFWLLAFPIPKKLGGDFFPCWLKNHAFLFLLFERIYPFLPKFLKPVKTFTLFVPNTVAFQK